MYLAFEKVFTNKNSHRYFVDYVNSIIISVFVETLVAAGCVLKSKLG